MRHPPGQHMTQSFAAIRRSSSRVTSALVFASAVMLAWAAFPGSASAQLLGRTLVGYASTDEAMTAPAPADEGVVPKPLRRTIIAFHTTDAPGTLIIHTANT